MLCPLLPKEALNNAGPGILETNPETIHPNERPFVGRCARPIGGATHREIKNGARGRNTESDLNQRLNTKWDTFPFRPFIMFFGIIVPPFPPLTPGHNTFTAYNGKRRPPGEGDDVLDQWPTHIK